MFFLQCHVCYTILLRVCDHVNINVTTRGHKIKHKMKAVDRSGFQITDTALSGNKVRRRGDTEHPLLLYLKYEVIFSCSTHIKTSVLNICLVSLETATLSLSGCFELITAPGLLSERTFGPCKRNSCLTSRPSTRVHFRFGLHGVSQPRTEQNTRFDHDDASVGKSEIWTVKRKK